MPTSSTAWPSRSSREQGSYIYDRHITQLAIEARNAELRKEKDPWELKYHDQAAIDHAIAHLNLLWDSDRGALRRPLAPDEQRFIRNERIVCALDFHYWLEHYAQIINWRKEPQLFTPNVAQSIVMELWAEDERNGVAVWMQQLKARRLGVSTISELNVTHRYQFQPYSNCVVASADPQKTIEMAGMIKFCLDNQPWWLIPTVTKVKHAIPVEFGKQHCTLAIEAGNQFTGVARGSAPNIIHLSELCEWQDPDDLIDGALLPAIIDTPNVFGILESTAKGPGWWKVKWEQNKRDWSRGTGRIRPVFLPWYVGTDIYPTPADMRKRPIPDGWIPEDRTIKHAERAREYVQTNPLLFKHLAKGDRDWKMPREQMWWREIGYQTAREQKTLHIFLAEYCADDFEAFQVQQNPLIDQEIIIAYQERTRQPLGVYTIIGPEIPPSLVAPTRDFDRSKPSITIDTRSLLPNYPAKFQLVPLRFEGYDTLDEQLKLLVWEWPDPAYKYGIGVDTSEGVGLDNACIEVMREATPIRECGQVAEWVANSVTAFQLWPLVMTVACWYSIAGYGAAEPAQCRLAIEAWMNGSSTQHELQKRGWRNFHPWHYNDSKRPKTPAQVNRVGIYTNQWFRASMQDLWLTCLKEEAIDIPSPYLVNEITTLENVDGKAQAMLGEHDDRWMAAGFPLYSLHINKQPGQQYTRRRVSYQPGLAEDQPIAHPTWTPPDQGRSDLGLRRPIQQVQSSRLRSTGGLAGRFRNPAMPLRHQ